MEIAPEVQEIEALAAQADIPMSRVLTKAGVALTTYWRWRHAGSEPNTGTIRKLKTALADLRQDAA
jgi:hypothetical protein